MPGVTSRLAMQQSRHVVFVGYKAQRGRQQRRNDKTTDGTGAGVYDSTLSVLTAGLTYRYRAYAVTADGTTYGNDSNV